MATKLQHGDSLYQVIEKVNEIIDGTVQPGSGGSGGGSSSNTNVTTSMLEAETDRATSAEQYLQDQIDIINNLIGAGDGDEADSNTGEDNELQAALIMESIHAATREHNNAQDIAGEVARATAAEQTLQTNIDDEVTRATTAEQNLQTDINDETTRATTAEQNLQDQIDAIDISGLQQDINDEVTRATAAEQGLQDQIDAIAQGDGIIHNLINDLPATVTANTLEYIVVNGICYISAWNIRSTVTGLVALSNNMPKAKINALGIFTDGTVNSVAGGDLYIEKNNPTRLMGIFPIANIEYYTSFSYPVDYS